MKIKKEQKEILDSLICERLSDTDVNETLVKSFASKRGASLVEYLQTFGMEEEREGKTAYYIIKTKEDEILMFFSMKCGALFEPLSEEEVKQDIQRLVVLVQAIENVNGELSELREADKILLKYQVGDRISPNDFRELLTKAEKKKSVLGLIDDDKSREVNDKITRVMATHSGIELVHFCTNDNMKSKWKDYDMGHPMGETLFWQFVASKIFEVQALAGCEYVFLFAADLSEDGSLVNYYDVSLNFKKNSDVGTNKPLYDLCCDFMCQEINDMKKNRELFFKNFNIDEEDIIA